MYIEIKARNNDNAETGLRSIYFYDTPGEDFRLNNVILRVRESRQNIWIDDWCEVTLKCRTGDIEKSNQFNPTPKNPLSPVCASKKKFYEAMRLALQDPSILTMPF